MGGVLFKSGVAFKWIRYIFQVWLIMTGKLPGPFTIEYFLLKDSDGNELEFPKMTAFTIVTSSLGTIQILRNQ